MVKNISGYLLVVSLVSCGGGGGSTDPVTQTEEGEIDSSIETLSLSTTEVIKRSVASESSPFAFKTSNSNFFKQRLDEIVRSAVTVENTTEPGDCGGQLVTTTTTTEPDDPSALFPRLTDNILNFENYCLGDSSSNAIVNGSVFISLNLQAFDDFVTILNYDIDYTSNLAFFPSGVISYSETCTTKPNVPEVCTSSSLYEDLSGESYSFTTDEVSGSASSGYNLSGVITDGSSNTYDVSALNFTQCDNGNVGTGSIEIITNEGEVININFPNCNECIISYQGISETIPQN